MCFRNGAKRFPYFLWRSYQRRLHCRPEPSNGPPDGSLQNQLHRWPKPSNFCFSNLKEPSHLHRVKHTKKYAFVEDISYIVKNKKSLIGTSLLVLRSMKTSWKFHIFYMTSREYRTKEITNHYSLSYYIYKNTQIKQRNQFD